MYLELHEILEVLDRTMRIVVLLLFNPWVFCMHQSVHSCRMVDISFSFFSPRFSTQTMQAINTQILRMVAQIYTKYCNELIGIFVRRLVERRLSLASTFVVSYTLLPFYL